MTFEIQIVIATFRPNNNVQSLKTLFFDNIRVLSESEVFMTMRSINRRFTYLLTYFRLEQNSDGKLMEAVTKTNTKTQDF